MRDWSRAGVRVVQIDGEERRLRRLRYQVAASLDGYIATPDGGYDWIVEDPDIDFGALMAQFDTAVMGRKTFLTTLEQGGGGNGGAMPGIEVVVFSRTLRAADYPAVTVVSGDPVEHVRALKAAAGKDIWLYGGGELFRTLLEAGLVDTVEPAIVPVLLGEGIPMLPATGVRTRLRLAGKRVYPKSGIVLLEYAVEAGQLA
jgi:dihydrofolate reductase